MNKAIVLITGTSAGRSKFNKIAKETCWVWSASPRDYLCKVSNNKFYWNGDKDDNFFKFITDLSNLVNTSYEFEKKYIDELVEKFRQTDDEVKTSYDEHGNQKTFNRFLLVIQDISKEFTEELKDDEGGFQIHITRRDLHTNIENHDLTLFEDDLDFEEQVQKTLNVLLDYKKEKELV